MDTTVEKSGEISDTTKNFQKYKKGIPLANEDGAHFTPEAMIKMLYETGKQCLPSEYMAMSRCRNIVRALIIFVANNPPSVAANLFKADQVSNHNPYHILSYSILSRNRRNWHHVFELVCLMVSEKERPKWMCGNTLLLRSCLKSNAVDLGRLMSIYKDDVKRASKFSWVVAYWIAKLYSVSIYRANPVDLPEPISEAYAFFILWKGIHWDTKVPSLALENDLYLERDELISCYPFTDVTEYTPTEEAKSYESWYDDGLVSLCDKLGEDMLLTYNLTWYKGSLLTFYAVALKSTSRVKTMTEFDLRLIKFVEHRLGDENKGVTKVINKKQRDNLVKLGHQQKVEVGLGF